MRYGPGGTSARREGKPSYPLLSNRQLAELARLCVAGRYFRVPAIFASAMLDAPFSASVTDEARGHWPALAVRAWGVLSFVGLVRALVERYHV